MSQPEVTPDPDDDSAEFAALLREVARPESVHLAEPPKSPVAELATALGHALNDAREPREGDSIDHYRLERVLGRGGMGVVFAAKNERTGKRVAIKWLSNLERADTQRAQAITARFRREARAAASIRHPNVVDVYDVGGEGGAPYLVMELLEGESLRALSDRGALSWSDACAIMLPVLRGVEAAHAAGIIHRDLKPDNVFLAKDAHGVVTPKVLDFGIASMRSTTADGLGTLTHTGSVLGTPSYMPLEQLKGEAVDTRADVYALGVLLYELLTQKLPFQARSASELAVKQATEVPTPVSKHNRELRGARETAVMRALARKASERYASVSAFAEVLRGAEGARVPVVYVAGALLMILVSALMYVFMHGAEPAELTAPKMDAPLRSPATVRAQVEAAPRQEDAPSLGSRQVTQEPPIAAPNARTRRRMPARAAAPAKPKSPTNLSIDDF